MITIIKNGDLFLSGCQAIVNTVNCQGVMGGGIAAIFRNKYPEMYVEYKGLCDDGELKPGILHIYDYNDPIIINFPTKNEVYFDSKMEYVESGLESLKNYLISNQIKSIAIPALGSGLGNLNWDEVLALILQFLDIPELSNCEIKIYEPH